MQPGSTVKVSFYKINMSKNDIFNQNETNISLLGNKKLLNILFVHYGTFVAEQECVLYSYFPDIYSSFSAFSVPMTEFNMADLQHSFTLECVYKRNLSQNIFIVSLYTKMKKHY